MFSFHLCLHTKGGRTPTASRQASRHDTNKSWRQDHDSDRCAAVFIISFVSIVLLSLRHVADIVSWLLGQPHTNCVETSIKTWDKRNKSWRQHHDSDRCAAVFIISFVSTSRRHRVLTVTCLWRMPMCGLSNSSGPYPSGFPTKALYAFLLSAKYATCSVHLILLNLITLFSPIYVFKTIPRKLSWSLFNKGRAA
jgi:hypothetical protein